MKSELELQDIEAIAQKVEERLKPIIARLGRNDDNNTIFDVQGLADLLKVSKKWIYANIKEMNIPYIKLRGHIRFKKSAIDKWLNANNVPAVDDSGRMLKAVK